MKKCKSCQTEIDVKATKCPHCQTDQRSWGRRHPILTTFLMLFIALVVIGALSDKKSNTIQTENTNTTSVQQGSEIQRSPLVTPTPSVESSIVDAKVLVADFDKNKLAAQEKYTGKLIQTTAYINNISGGDFGSEYYLSLSPSDDKYYFGTSIQCYFSDKTSLTSLQKDQKITVVGTMDNMSIGTIQMKKCKVI